MIPIDRAVGISIEGVAEELRDYFRHKFDGFQMEHVVTGYPHRATVWADSLPMTIFKLEQMPVGRLLSLKPCLPGIWRADCSNCGCYEYHEPDDFVCVFCREARHVGNH